MHVKTALLSCVLMLSAAGAARATTTVYTDEASYLAAISAAATDSYDDLAITSYGASIARSVGDYSYQLSATNGLYGAGEGSDGWISTNDPIQAITFSDFTNGVSAIGGYFFGSNASGGYADIGAMSLTFTDASGAQTVRVASWPTASTFLGFVSSDGIQSLSVQVTGFPLENGMTPEEAAAYFQWPTANDVILGQSPQDAPPPPLAVPEPASWAMMLVGFGLVGAATRGRRRPVVSFR